MDSESSTSVNSCQQHPNPRHAQNTTKEERAELLSNYLNAIQPVTSDPLLMPLEAYGKHPIIQGRCRLNSRDARSFLVNGNEAVQQIRERGHRGFCLYAGKQSHNTEKLVFTDHDNTDLWPLESIPETLTVMSGSGTGYHKTFVNAGNVGNAKAKDALEGAGEVRADGWYVVLPGSIHPSSGIYHQINSHDIATLQTSDLPSELQPRSGTRKSTNRLARSDIQGLSSGFDPDTVVNELGYTLGEVRSVSTKLNRLLTDLNPGYQSVSEADMATVSLLLYWRFEEPDIPGIIRACRPRGKLNKHPNYLPRTVTRTTHTRVNPIGDDIGRAVMESAKDHGGKPVASVITLSMVKGALQLCGGKADTNEIARFLGRRDVKQRSLERRVTRAMDIFEAAGYVSWTKDGRQTVYTDEGLDDLVLPGEV